MASWMDEKARIRTGGWSNQEPCPPAACNRRRCAALFSESRRDELPLANVRCYYGVNRKELCAVSPPPVRGQCVYASVEPASDFGCAGLLAAPSSHPSCRQKRDTCVLQLQCRSPCCQSFLEASIVAKHQENFPVFSFYPISFHFSRSPPTHHRRHPPPTAGHAGTAVAVDVQPQGYPQLQTAERAQVSRVCVHLCHKQGDACMLWLFWRSEPQREENQVS
ncbi:hypothetical protein B0J13DRAFT_185843 [Dactylonectria estremocensis]|uniref:Uncharacterized protein n=1 Tax=Dactylonectria estremocensis TaxID=1079267 RepID=A0A9P9FCT2_9HYPO|nr:hypothetical protein B0J13DRAFT_185843 [Dactylonectria estremocensis]